MLYRGRALKASKASPLVELYGALEMAEAYAFYAASVLPRPQARAMRLIGRSLMELGFYLATGGAERLGRAVELLRRALKLVYSLPGAGGWVVCASLECAAADLARAWIRYAERRAAAAGEAEAVKLLNHLSNIAFEVMASLPHRTSWPGPRPGGRGGPRL